MPNKENKPIVKIVSSQDAVILALEEKAFCVALSKEGSTLKKESRTADGFLDAVNSSIVTWVDYVADDFKKDGMKTATGFGFSETLVNTLIKNKRSGYEDFNNEMGIFIPAIVVDNYKVNLNSLLILLRSNMILTIHTTEVKRFFRLRRYAETFMRKIKTNIPLQDKITHVLIRIIDENNNRNFDHLHEIEEYGDKLSEQLSKTTNSNRSGIASQIHHMKHSLITYLDGLWATNDVLNALRYGDAEILTDNQKLLDRIGALVSEVHTQIGLAEHLSEVLASGLEVLQSIYNNQLQVLNNRLAMLVAYLTIIGTAVLVPNTIATVLGNPVYGLTSKDMLWFTFLIIFSTIFSTVAAYWFVKKEGWLPSSPV